MSSNSGRGAPALVLVLALLLGAVAAQGQVDAVFANLLSENRVCLNDGTGALTCSDLSADTNDSVGVALADVDGVTGLDVVLANDLGANRVCLNDGTGSFTCSQVSSDANSTQDVALADVDGVDGIDAVFANFSENRVCLNDGTGAFTCSDLSSDTNSTRGVALGDVDGVNGIDAVFANDGQENRVCLNDGSGAFTCSDVGAETGQFNDVALADVDGVDGVDAVFARVGDTNRVCLNDGTGDFSCSDVSSDTKFTNDVALADVDGVDGIDAVFANDGQENRVCLNDGSGAFTCSDLGTDTNSSEGVALADIDGVAGTDAVFANRSEINRVCLNDGTGSFTCSDLSADTNVTYAVALGFFQLPDLAVTKTDGQTTAVPGETLTYVIAATNPGPAPTSATVGDTFEELSCVWTCVGDGGATCTEGPVNGDISDVAVLPAGGVATYFAVCAVDAAAAGTLTNTATLSPAEGFDPDTTNNTATDIDALTPQADLAITKTDGQAAAVPGSTVSYVIGVSNPGPSDVDGAQVNDPFSSLLSCTWTCAASGGASCTPGPVAGDIDDSVDLPEGGAVGYLAVCIIESGATGILVNKASVSPPAGVTDPDATNDSAADFDQLTPEADLTITKDDGVTFVTPGDPVTYTIVAANPGPSDALAATVEDLFPAELIDCEWSCTPAGGALCTGGPVAGDLVDSVDLPAGGSATYTATCTVDPGVELTVLENTATIAAPDGVSDPEPGNDSATDSDAGPMIFADGFESGNTSAWSATVP